MAHLLIVDIAAPAALASMHVLRALYPVKIGSLVSKERKYWMPLPVIDGKRITTLGFTTDTTAVSVRRYAPIRRFHEISLLLPKEPAQQRFPDGDSAIGTYFQAAITPDTGIVIKSDTLDMVADGLDRTIAPALAAQFAFLVV